MGYQTDFVGYLQVEPPLNDTEIRLINGGMVVGARRDTRELYAICLQDNDLSVELLWPGNKDWSTYPPLAYQVAIDRFREWSAPRDRP
jgi:hypothetical protein